MRFENFAGRNNKEMYNDDLKHNSYPLMNNQKTILSKAERDHIMLFNPLPLDGSLSGSFTGKTGFLNLVLYIFSVLIFPSCKT